MNRIIVSVEEKVGHPRDWERTKVGKNPEGTPNGVGGGCTQRNHRSRERPG